MLLSIIIPVYNTEPYVKGTLESIFSQRCRNALFEVIIVNDGTPDHAMDIVYEYAETYSEIRVIEQENQGLSAARNNGLKVAKGDVVWFVDSDDTITQDAFSVILKVLNHDAEIYAFGLNCVDEVTRNVRFQPAAYEKYGHRYENRVMSGIDLQRKVQMTPVQRFLYKRDFLEKHRLTFFPGIYHEDNEFQPRANYFAKRVYVGSEAIYNYLLRANSSITATPRMKNLEDKLMIISSLERFVQTDVCVDKGRQMIYDNIFTLVLSFTSHQSRIVDGYTAFMVENASFLSRKLNMSFWKSWKFCSFGKMAKYIRGMVALWQTI